MSCLIVAPNVLPLRISCCNEGPSQSEAGTSNLYTISRTYSELRVDRTKQKEQSERTRTAISVDTFSCKYVHTYAYALST